MNLKEADEYVKLISFPEYTFGIRHEDQSIFLSATYLEEDAITGKKEIQTTREWYIPESFDKDQFIQTALKLILTSKEHSAREHFLYRGKAIFMPHFNVDQLFHLTIPENIVE